MKSKRRYVLYKYHRLLNEYVSTPLLSIYMNNADACADIYTTQNFDTRNNSALSSFAGLFPSLKKS